MILESMQGSGSLLRITRMLYVENVYPEFGNDQHYFKAMF